MVFGRNRSRAGSNASFNQNVANTNSNAASAAAQAFLKNQASNASLAAAAAGAALRSRPTTPSSVADVQTKRTMRRTNSNSSMGSAVGSVQGRPTSQLERRGSTSSMTERTFRTPSPNRGEQAVPSAPDAPPVPAIPKKLAAKSQRRAASVEPPPMRVASPPPRVNGRGSSLGPTGGAPLAARATRQRMSGLSNVQEMPGLERTDSRGSVNFSYPTGNRPMSPYGPRKLTSPTPSSVQNQSQNLVYDPNTRSFRPEAELLFYEQRILDASRPVRKPKPATQTAEGSHLAQGSMDGRPKGTAVTAMEAAKVAKPVSKPQQIQPVVAPAQPPPVATESTAPVTKKKKKKVVIASDSETSDLDSDVDRPQQFNTRTGALLMRQPSVIKEGDEEDDENIKALGRQEALRKLESPPSPAIRPTSPTALPRSSAGRDHGKGETKVPAAESIPQAAALSVGQPPITPATPVANGLMPAEKTRVQSISPSRKAHFLTTPESSSTRHDPPARSISPRKSALKHSPSPRGPSPVGDMPGAFIVPGHASTTSETSEASNDTITPSEASLIVPKKKSVRVSFDDNRNEVLGRAAPQPSTDSPIIASPQSKKGWFSIGGRKKKEAVAAEEDDEKMAPRPALPSFGSVREKKVRDVEERQLVTSPTIKPAAITTAFADSTAIVDPPASPIFTTATGEAIEYPMGQSNDHGIGALVAQDHVTKNMANISKVREPVPSETISKEVSGYHSDNSSVYDEQIPASAISRSNSTRKGPEDGHAEAYRALASPVPEDPENEVDSKSNGNGHIPEIALTTATPTIEEPKREWPEMPGGFPAQSSSESGRSESVVSTIDPLPSTVQHVPTEPTPADIGIAEPEPVHATPDSVTQAIAHQELPTPIAEETEESDADMYSDAAEDLSDLEGDGFMSLNAVVESPVLVPPTSRYGRTSPPDSPTGRMVKDRAYKKSQLTRKSSEPDLDEGWEKAQQYWSGLTAEKKREMELAALQDDDSSGEETPTEDTKVIAPPQPKLKPALKKTVPATASVEPETRAISTERQYQINPGQKHSDHPVPSMRTSMRSAPTNTAEEPHMRRSMRDGSTGSTRSSMRNSMRDSQQSAPASEPRGALQKKNRPLSIPAPEPEMDPAERHKLEVQKHVRALSAASAASAAKASTASNRTSTATTLQRKGSDASESSFKRKRGDGQSSMRGSMRNPATNGPSRPISPEPTRSSRFSIRSLSPTGSAFRRPFSSNSASVAPPVSMSKGRQTMRNRTYSNESNTATLRSIAPSERAKSPTGTRTSLFGRDKKTKAKAKPAGTMRTSRFADSSDEDEPVRGAFRSRFNDSSDDDDDEPTPVVMPRQRMTTMRAQAPAAKRAPAASRVADSDSDSDEEKPRISAASPKTGNEGTALASGSLRRSGSGRETLGVHPANLSSGPASPSADGARPGHKRRGSFMSSILGRKKDKSSGVKKSTAESPARRDTPLERNPSELAAVRQNTALEAGRPKLQKRNTSQGGGSFTPTANGAAENQAELLSMGADWPLGKSTAELSNLNDSEGRPFTADGLERNGSGLGTLGMNGIDRPDLGARRVTDISMAGSGRGVGAKKKKKFGMLRRAFGLDV